MDPLVALAFAAVALLPPRLVFDEDALTIALAGLTDWEGARPFVELTTATLRAALLAAADAGLVRDIEIAPGRFVVVRTERRPEAPRTDLVPIMASLHDIGTEQPDPASLDRALAVPIETVALRRAIISPTQFVWPADDYAALIAAAQRLPEDER
jgi:hypothetical protein